MSVVFTEAPDNGWTQAQAQLDELCSRWNRINMSLEAMSDDDADAAYDEICRLNDSIKKARAKVYRLARRAGVVLPGSRWARQA